MSTGTFGLQATGTRFNDTTTGGAPASNDTQMYLAWLNYQKDPALQQFVQTNYAQYAWMLANPELAPILVATAANGWGADQVASELDKTNWWKTNGQNVANWQTLQASDPATAAQQVTDMKAAVLNEANTLGVSLTDQQMTQLATQAMEYGWSSDPSMLRQQVANMSTQTSTPGTYNFAPTGVAASFQNQLKGLLQQYAVPVSQATQDWWTSLAVKGATGGASSNFIDGVTNYLRQQASQLYPWMSHAIADGITPADYLSPYASVASNLLGVSASSIDWTDPKWGSALVAQGPGGQSQPVSTQQFATTLRSDPAFGYSTTPTAISNAYSMTQQIEQAFGKVKA